MSGFRSVSRSLVSFCLLLVPVAQAATPASGTVSDTKTTLTYTSGPFAVSNVTSTASLTCMDPVAPCDDFQLTISVPAGFSTTHSGTVVKVSTAWTNTAEDYDVYAYDSAGGDAGKSASSSDPEQFSIPVLDGTHTYTIRIVPYTVAGGSTTTTLSFSTQAVTTTPVPTQKQPSGLPPRFKTDVSPAALGNTAGEPSIGYNFKSRNGMFISSLQTLKITYPWNQPDPVETSKVLPEACDATWSDVSYVTTSQETLDPILHTNSKAGRTYVSQITASPGLLSAYSDDDGTSWTSIAAPPSSSTDHQTIGTGPYPAGSQFAAIAAAAGVDYATYYCGQNMVGAACARSDTGGATFNNGVPIFSTEVNCNEPLGGLHGHVKVGPDGAVYVPPKSCDNQQAVIVSLDAGLTWAVNKLPKTDADTEIDPSVGIASDNTVYDCYVANNGHPHVQVSKDHGVTWFNDYDIGTSQGIQLATFPTAIAGDPDRAACAFLGSTTAGNHDSASYQGIWYGFVAMTYDGGLSWHTVNVTPNNPVQGAGGVCNGGTLVCGTNRNLLDFNEITMDEKGRVMFGYADGCISTPCVTQPLLNSDFAKKASVARQTGGRGLLKKFDPVTAPATAQAACLAGNRNSKKSTLTWKTPDSGGADISGYSIFRSTALAGPYTQVGTAPAKNTYDDTTTQTSDPTYYYKIVATNAVGDGLASNVVKLVVAPDPVVETSCKLPGLTTASDPAGDSTGGVAATDLLTIYMAELPATPNSLTFVETVSSLSTLPPNTLYAVRFHAPNPPSNGDSDYFVGMATESGTPRYVYGTVGVVDANATSLAVYTVLGDIDAASTYDPKTGFIYLHAKKSLFGNLKTGDNVIAIVGTSRPYTSLSAKIGAGAQDTTGTGSYTLNGTAICVANVAPIASLLADVQSGTRPLTVKFDGSGSSDSDAGDSVASYTFDFGDGTAPVTQPTPTATHVYNSSGNFNATLSVNDSHGLASSNTASKFIEVKDAGTTTGTTTGGSTGTTTGGTTGGGTTGGTTGGTGTTTGTTTGSPLPSPTEGGTNNGNNRLGGGGSLGVLDLGLCLLALGLRRRRQRGG